jgi:DNA-binding response OmpR family regulator
MSRVGEAVQRTRAPGADEAESPLVLVVEDDPDIWRSLQIILGRAGYRLGWAADGVEGLQLFNDQRPDLVVVDIGLPKVDGWVVLERIRQMSSVPILLLTARGLETDKVRGLLGGADDYLTKPYSNDELVARIGRLLRRCRPGPEAPRIYDDGRLRIDFLEHSVEADGRPVDLTPTEFRLLAVLVRHADEVMSVSRLLELGWSDVSGSGRGRVKFSVLSLRRKLGWGDVATSPVETVRGFGYRYRPPGS